MTVKKHYTQRRGIYKRSGKKMPPFSRRQGRGGGLKNRPFPLNRPGFALEIKTDLFNKI
jgi:hypothetical protein